MKLNSYFEYIVYLDTFYKSFKGLMLKKSIDKKNCYILKTQGIHTFFMRFSIDVVYLNKNKEVIKIIKNMKPCKVGPLLKECKYVIEFINEEFIDKINLNDKIEF
jgi:uncharacterized membrane protein (UPF0127 family)